MNSGCTKESTKGTSETENIVGSIYDRTWKGHKPFNVKFNFIVRIFRSVRYFG